MSQYLILSKVSVQNANAIAGFTWGFPAISGFLGFTHALNRKLSNAYQGKFDTELSGCAVISHEYAHKVYRPSPKSTDVEFLQSKNPPVLAKHKKGSPPIIEEGKMNLTVSLVIKLDSSLPTSDEIKVFKQAVSVSVASMRMVGGTILNIGKVEVLTHSDDKSLQKIKRLISPGFILKDRSEYLREHFEKLKSQNKEQELFDAWLDYSALKRKADPKLVDDETLSENTKADWNYIKKPHSGWLVPLMTGFKALGDLLPAGEVGHTRDKETPAQFVEAIHSIGEWINTYKIKQLNEFIWHYEYSYPWYLCRQINITPITDEASELNDSKDVDAFFKNING